MAVQLYDPSILHNQGNCAELETGERFVQFLMQLFWQSVLVVWCRGHGIPHSLNSAVDK